MIEGKAIFRMGQWESTGITVSVQYFRNYEKGLKAAYLSCMLIMHVMYTVIWEHESGPGKSPELVYLWWCNQTKRIKSYLMTHWGSLSLWWSRWENNLNCKLCQCWPWAIHVLIALLDLSNCSNIFLKKHVLAN